MIINFRASWCENNENYSQPNKKGCDMLWDFGIK